jgi:putative addiction module component (TIGR02574 family)
VVSISEVIAPAFYNALQRGFEMAQMTPEVARLLEQALTLSVEEQEALADSLISNLGGKVDEGVLAAWDEEIKRRIADLEAGKAKTISWTEVRQRNLAKLPRAH